MNTKFVFYLVGTMLWVLSPLLAVCALLAWIDSGSLNAPDTRAFLLSFISMAATGGALSANLKYHWGAMLLRRDGIGVVVFSWLAVCFFGALPYYFYGAKPSHAFFESVSGFTTTGSSIYADIEALPRSILMWRGLTQWVGGLGILVFMVALLTKLGIRGRALVGAESTVNIGASSTSKIKDLAGNLLAVYLFLTLGCFFSLLIAGQFSPVGITWLEAFLYSMTTVSTGGLAPHNNSVSHFDSVAVEAVLMVFMLVSSLSFVMLYRMFRSGDFKPQAGREEAATLFLIVGMVTAGITLNLVFTQNMPFPAALRQASFPVVSLASSTGFGTTDFDQWPLFSKILLGFVMFIGGCEGSTSGGLKVMRFVAVLKILNLEARKTFRPRLVEAIRLDGKTLSETSQYRVLVFAVTFTLLVAVSSGLVSLMEPSMSSFEASIGAVLATISNMGPGFGELGPTDNFSSLQPHTLYFLSWMMLMGRLEIFVFLALFSPSLWKA